METESKQQILERRKEIEQELMDMLQETESDFTMSPHQNFWCGDVDHVRDAILHEEDNDDMIYPHTKLCFMYMY